MQSFSRVKFSISFLILLSLNLFGNGYKKIEKLYSQLKGFKTLVVYDLSRNKLLISKNSKNLFKPASILKVITAYSYLKTFSPEKKFHTRVYLDSLPDKNGIVKGSIYIFGDGDPSLSYRFFDNDREKPMEYFVDEILKNFNIKGITGNIVVDDSKYLYKPYGPSWSWEVFQWAYGVKVSAISLNDNTFNVKLIPTKNGKRIEIETTPKFMEKEIINNCISRKNAVIKDLVAFKPFDSDKIFLGGFLPLKLPNWNLKIAMTDPALFFGKTLKEELKKRGIKVNGKVKVIHRYHYLKFKKLSYRDKVMIKISGKYVKEVIKKMLKKSINLYAELLLRDMGSLSPFNKNRDERKLGLEREYKVLFPILKKDKNALIVDGSGLSQRNLITPLALIKVLKKIYRWKYFGKFLKFLPISGIDGTLKNRLKGKYRGRIFAKTGQIEEVVSRLGYIKTFSGKYLAFVLITNNDPNYKLHTKDIFDKICKVLCKF